MIQWGYDRKSIWVDTVKNTVWIGSDCAVTIMVVNQKMCMTAGAGFDSYVADQSWQTIFSESNAKLTKYMIPTKGVGKGPKGKTKNTS